MNSTSAVDVSIQAVSPVFSMVIPPVTATAARSDRVLSRLAGADAHGGVQVVDEDLAVSDLPGLRRFQDRVAGLVDHVVGQRDLELDLRQQIDGVFGTAIELGVALLPAEAPDLGDGHPLH